MVRCTMDVGPWPMVDCQAYCNHLQVAGDTRHLHAWPPTWHEDCKPLARAPVGVAQVPRCKRLDGWPRSLAVVRCTMDGEPGWHGSCRVTEVTGVSGLAPPPSPGGPGALRSYPRDFGGETRHIPTPARRPGPLDRSPTPTPTRHRPRHQVTWDVIWHPPCMLRPVTRPDTRPVETRHPLTACLHVIHRPYFPQPPTCGIIVP